MTGMILGVAELQWDRLDTWIGYYAWWDLQDY
jgi:hypothetical protein